MRIAYRSNMKRRSALSAFLPLRLPAFPPSCFPAFLLPLHFRYSMSTSSITKHHR